jgi:5-methyltetrahydropteroyltriglutamate--homocysteine methyltransferase
VGNKPDQQKLRRAYNQLDKGKIMPDEVAQLLDKTVADAINEQLESGCDLITDGQIRTYDPLSYIAGKIDGFEIGGLLRFFDTNFLYRQPKIIGKLAYREQIIAGDFEFARSRADSKATAVMFGPYSLLKMSVYEDEFESLLDDLCDIYSKELKNLGTKGASLVQLDEPAIIHNPDDISMMISAYKKISNARNLPETVLAFYFGNATPLLDHLNELPVSGFLFDFSYSPGLDDALAGFNKDIGLGIIDGRNTKMEDTGELAKRAEYLISRTGSNKVYITSSCGLEFLPRDRAFAKLKLAANVVSKLKGARNE